MSIAERFARAQGHKDQRANKELAHKIVISSDHTAVTEIGLLLKTTSDVEVLADGLKVIEMVGEQLPELAKDTFNAIFPLLDHPVNQLQWRAMSALSTIAQYHQTELFASLSLLLRIMDSGSVVTRDHGFSILVLLYQNPAYRDDLSCLIQEQLLRAPDNQLGQYAEKWQKVIQKEHCPALEEVLQKRLAELANPSHQNRIGKILRRIGSANQ